MPKKRKRPCKVRTGPRGGRFYVQRRKQKHGGGTSKVYLKPGQKPPKK